MGVHDLDKYAEIKEALGIPEDEPIFIIRAKDRLAPTIIDLYDLIYMSTAKVAGVTASDAMKFSDDIRDVYDAVADYQRTHPDTVKVPD